MIPAASRFGPWRDGLDAAERRAETDPEHLEPALHQLGLLAALDRRAVLASFAALHHSN